jgi:hypothetical protein
MKISETGSLVRGVPKSSRAILTFPSVVPLSNRTLLATCRAGSTKNSADEIIELFRSVDGGRTWGEPTRCFEAMKVNGLWGSLIDCYITELSAGHLLAGCTWVDRESYPGKPLFNPETEGCLPMSILLGESNDFGESWTPFRVVPMPEDIGPASLTNPILKLSDGRLAMSIETNKHYEDRSKWYQRVVFCHSSDLGRTWDKPIIAGQDPTGRIFNWDQRAGVAYDGRIVTFLWTYDSAAHTYLNIHRRISSDGGQNWSPAQDLGFTDQASHPAILPDGRVVLAWVDRFHSRTIRARLADSIDATFDPATEVVIYSHSTGAQTLPGDDTGAMLTDMALWTFGLPYAEALPDGDVIIFYYAGSENCMDIHWSRLQLG